MRDERGLTERRLTGYAMDREEMLGVLLLDAAVLIGGCDKTG